MGSNTPTDITQSDEATPGRSNFQGYSGIRTREHGVGVKDGKGQPLGLRFQYIYRLLVSVSNELTHVLVQRTV